MNKHSLTGNRKRGKHSQRTPLTRLGDSVQNSSIGPESAAHRLPHDGRRPPEFIQVTDDMRRIHLPVREARLHHRHEGGGLIEQPPRTDSLSIHRGGRKNKEAQPCPCNERMQADFCFCNPYDVDPAIAVLVERGFDQVEKFVDDWIDECGPTVFLRAWITTELDEARFSRLGARPRRSPRRRHHRGRSRRPASSHTALLVTAVWDAH